MPSLVKEMEWSFRLKHEVGVNWLMADYVFDSNLIQDALLGKYYFVPRF